MQVPSMAWLQARLNQLQGTTPNQNAVLDSLEALLSMFHCQVNGVDDFAALAQLSRALIQTEAQSKMVQALKRDPACAALITERYLPSRHNLNALRSFSQDSLGYAYATWMQDTTLYSDLYSDITIDSDASYVEARLGQTHDLWHLITGFDTSVADEIGLQTFHLAQFPYPLAAMLIANALVTHTLLEPQNLPQLLASIETGWVLGKQAKPLFAQKWENVWAKPIVQLRQELNLVSPKSHPPMPGQRRPSLKTPAAVRIRSATVVDIPFLSSMIYEASLPPLNQCFWAEILQKTNTDVLPFIETMLRAGAANWGNVEDFLILEEQGKPVAAAAGYTPNSEDYRPLRLSKLDQMAQDLNWSPEMTTTFSDHYQQFWGDDCRPIFLTPLAPWMIENVAVLPEARGRGLGKMLLREMLEVGRLQQHSHAGIMVVNGNDAARRTYESLGFKPYQTFHAEYFSDQFNLEFPGVTKFGLRLQESRY